jgi:PAS domain S-box-containing protein
MILSNLPHELMLSALMTHTPDHVYFKDTGSRFVWVSDSLARSFGCRIEEIIGRTDEDFFDADRARTYRKQELEVITTGNPVIDRIVKHERPDGQITWSLNVAMPLRNESGDIIGVWGTNKDITKSKLTEEALERRTE